MHIEIVDHITVQPTKDVDVTRLGFEEGDGCAYEHEIPMFSVSIEGHVSKDENYQGTEDPLGILEKAVANIKARRAEQERRDRISDDRTQIVAAAEAGKIGKMSALLQNSEYDPVEDQRFWANQENRRWNSRLDQVGPLSREAWQVLIDAGVGINTIDWDGMTPLIAAIDNFIDYYGECEYESEKKEACFGRVQMLLELGANPNARRLHPNHHDILGHYPLFGAIESCPYQIPDPTTKSGKGRHVHERQPSHCPHPQGRRRRVAVGFSRPAAD